VNVAFEVLHSGFYRLQIWHVNLLVLFQKI